MILLRLLGVERGMGSGSSEFVTYKIWEFGKDKRGRWGFHQKFVLNRGDSEAVRNLVCLKCKHLRWCPRCCLLQCVFSGRALRYEPCRSFVPLSAV